MLGELVKPDMWVELFSFLLCIDLVVGILSCDAQSFIPLHFPLVFGEQHITRKL